MSSHLVLFELNPTDPHAVTQIFRLVHTIKGTCGFLGLERLQSIAHAAETLIDTLRNGAPPTAIAVSLLLQAMDRIKQLLARIGELGEEPPGDDADIAGQIGAYLRGGPSGESLSPQKPEPVPGAGGKSRPGATKAKRSKAPRRADREIEIVRASAGPEAKPEAGAKETEHTAAKEKAPDTIRISVATIQRIMDLVSELVLTRNQMMEMSRQHNLNQIKSPLERLSTVTSDLQDAVMQARMQPMGRLLRASRAWCASYPSSFTRSTTSSLTARTPSLTVSSSKRSGTR